jgi:alkanesulfonate monooxygenase SsuD/methylene tetrahydromethanopterin reductase-like flavin-dependent oxidoreductase (luciferase family)
MGATIQTLTKGRFVLGIGAGWMKEAYIAYGYEFPSAKVRIAQLEEGVQIIKKMWTEGTATFNGRYYRVDEAYCYPKPDPVPPIMIGGTGEKLILRVIARHADWWNVPTISFEVFRHKLNVLKEHCKEVGRDCNDIDITHGNNLVALAKTEKQAWDLARKSPFFEKGKEDTYIIGSPDIVKEKLEEFINLGVQHFILRFADFPKTNGAKLFAQEIIPELA